VASHPVLVLASAEHDKNAATFGLSLVIVWVLILIWWPRIVGTFE